MINAWILAAVALLADWENLKEITKSRYYEVALRDGRCVGGRLVSSNDHQLVLDSGTWDRSDVLRVSDRPYPIYSGRSSWSDVLAVRPYRSEYLQVVTKDGRKFKWNRPRGIDITEGAVPLAQNDARLISYVRFTPLTLLEEGLDTEGADVLAPRLWFKNLMLPKITVTLYDSAQVEDNSKLGCR